MLLKFRVGPRFKVLADSKYIFIVLPFCKDGELFDRLDNAGECFDEKESRHWFKQICQGVHSLHQAGVNCQITRTCSRRYACNGDES